LSGKDLNFCLLARCVGDNATGTVTQQLVDNIVRTQRAWREGIGPDTLLKLDLNFNFRPEGYIRICKALEPLNMDWIELDVHDPQSLRQIRDASPSPIASLESLFGRKQFKPYLDAGAVDIAIIDAIW
jgi:galactonate dehydratase